MFKKISLFSGILILAMMLSACSSLSISPAANTTGGAAPASTAQPSIENKLGIGILKLEGSDQAVTSAQASNLLFLWKGVKLLSVDKTASTLELTALYQQIEEVLTPNQVEAIRQVSWSQTEVEQYVSKATSLGGVSNVALTTSTSSTKSSSSANSQMGGAGGPPGGGGGPSAEMALISGMSVPVSTTSTTTAQSAASASAAKVSSSPNSAATALNAQLANSVIALLQERAGGSSE